MLDPRRLLTFREVAERRSFSRAAEALALTQPAVSQQVGALERQLGTELLERRPGGLVLTEAGELLLEHASALSDRLRLADTQLTEHVTSDGARLRIGSFPSALASVVPHAIGALRADDPDMLVEAQEGVLADLVAGVLSGDLHVAICFEGAAAEPLTPGLERHELGREPMVAAGLAVTRVPRLRAGQLPGISKQRLSGP